MGERSEIKLHIPHRGVLSVSPADIFRSAKGQEAIRKTARMVTVQRSNSRGLGDVAARVRREIGSNEAAAV